ncbi:hypothetical protein UNPF46_29955 [Bradyrhizobium sp. UNPF46]|uniref:hypothetical protein n=1 Tax=Bradyrhizobium sp. UNPF46 TaxID=1141168 RepID=UPI0011506461|nr:hypothetical protein [Bradyrhizobium sp. UNPF46]TQF27561.1 hypothetical protein UNPF46_29955 [Bradyrhizobium sp. UNPF46]
MVMQEDDFAEAADCPPDIAFVRLERKLRVRLNNQANLSVYELIEYMEHTKAVADALGLTFLAPFTIPHPSSSDVPDEFRIFKREVDRFAIRSQIANARAGDPQTVVLSPDEKKHVRAYIEKVKEIIEVSSLAQDKKENLLDKLNAFLKELDRDRTGLQKFNDIFLSLARTGGAATKEMEPAWKWVKLAAEVLGVRQEAQETRQLPSPTKSDGQARRQLPSPAKKKGDEDAPAP